MKTFSKNRRRPVATMVLIFASLTITGFAYTAFTKAKNADAATETSQTVAATAENVLEGEKLFLANCATCHGYKAEGTNDGPSLIGVGAASVDFQVGTGRMPLAISGPQAASKPPQFNSKQTSQLSAYVASLAPGPEIPSAEYLTNSGNAANGGELFRINCAMCHNANAVGGALTRGKYAPSLHGVEPKYVYEAMLTGPQQMPVFNDANISPTEKRDIITFLNTIENQGSPGGFSLGSLGPVSEGLFIWLAGIGMLIALTVWLTKKSS